MDDKNKYKIPYFLVSIIIVLLTILFIIMFMFSSSTSTSKNINERFEINDAYDTTIFMDRDTGVYYLIVEKDNNIAVTPLYNIDGLPLCSEDVNHSGDMEMYLKDIHHNLTN